MNGMLIFDETQASAATAASSGAAGQDALTQAQLDRINAALDQTDNGNSCSYLICRAGKEEFALSANQLREVVRFIGATRVPLTGGCIAGVVNMKGRICAVLSLRSCLGLEPGGPASGPQQLLVLDQSCEDVCLLVDGVSGLLSADDTWADGITAGKLLHGELEYRLLNLENILAIGRRQCLAV
jgi:purine-binding chemotaxis protein CheW